MAQKFGGRLFFMTVVPDNLLKGYYPDVYSKTVGTDAREKLQEIVKEIVPDVMSETILLKEGGICSEIIRAAREIPIDLIVMASHGPIIRDYLLGSNATHIALHTPCSVFIVRDKHSDDPHGTRLE
jgi:nucleotide-binding universal stress UspA family protein